MFELKSSNKLASIALASNLFFCSLLNAMVDVRMRHFQFRNTFKKSVTRITILLFSIHHDLVDIIMRGLKVHICLVLKFIISKYYIKQ